MGLMEAPLENRKKMRHAEFISATHIKLKPK